MLIEIVLFLNYSLNVNMGCPERQELLALHILYIISNLGFIDYVKLVDGMSMILIGDGEFPMWTKGHPKLN